MAEESRMGPDSNEFVFSDLFKRTDALTPGILLAFIGFLSSFINPVT